MTFYSTDYINNTSDYQECYKYVIAPFTVKDYLRGFSIFAPKFLYEYADSSNGPDITHANYVLVGYMIAISGGDPYDKIVPIALASELAELKVLADMNILDPLSIVNKLSGF